MQTAIEQGLTIISWYENLPKEEVPPEYLWEDSEGLEKWWKTVEDRKGDGSTGSMEMDDSLEENDLARMLKE